MKRALGALGFGLAIFALVWGSTRPVPAVASSWSPAGEKVLAELLAQAARPSSTLSVSTNNSWTGTNTFSRTITSTVASGSNALVIASGALICFDGSACTKTLTYNGSAFSSPSGTAFSSAGGFTVASGTGIVPGVSVNTNHVAFTGKGADFASFDSTASPGAANAGTFPMGKAAIAASAGSVVVTTSAARALSSIFITPIDADTTCVQWKVTSADGSFTVTTYNGAGVAANCNATWKFNWVAFGKSQYE